MFIQRSVAVRIGAVYKPSCTRPKSIKRNPTNHFLSFFFVHLWSAHLSPTHLTLTQPRCRVQLGFSNSWVLSKRFISVVCRLSTADNNHRSSICCGSPREPNLNTCLHLLVKYKGKQLSAMFILVHQKGKFMKKNTISIAMQLLLAVFPLEAFLLLTLNKINAGLRD